MLKRVVLGVCLTHLVYKLWKYLKYTGSENEEKEIKQIHSKEDIHEEEKNQDIESKVSSNNIAGKTDEKESKGLIELKVSSKSADKTDVNSNITDCKNFSQHNFRLKVSGYFSSIPIYKKIILNIRVRCFIPMMSRTSHR